MEANENKDLEKFVDRMMSDLTLESPSVDFTSKVMTQVAATKASDVTLYKPLIPKSIFIAVFGFTCLLTIYLFIYGETTPESWLNFINYDKLFNTRFLKGFAISKISMYAIVASTVMFCIQIGFLRNYFNKRIGV
ncbi:hypothetical protein [Flavobacterium polysaccharolyticum]|uniref:Uncharacterized protein n=1 Tax=Flavobacterium polysaccharolyticum TaxID=3133148 RepID=A0ABU9NJQ3_9FLAO